MKDFFKMLLASCLGVILASFAVLFICFAMIGSIIDGVMSAVKGDEKAKTETTLKQESVLLLDLQGTIAEKPTLNFSEYSFSKNEKRNFVLSEVLQAIDIARSNPKIEAIVLNLEDAHMGFAVAKEMRDALLRFKESGKMIYAYSASYDNTLNYYVSSVADELYAGPMGFLGIAGLYSVNTFYTGLLDKLGVDVQVFKVGTFKGAVEPFLLNQLSPENRLQIETYVNGLWTGLKEEIAASRGVEPSVLQTFADEGRFLEGNKAGLEVHLIDSLVHEVDWNELLALRVNGDKDLKVKKLRVDEVLRLKRTKMESEGKIAVLFAEGNIVVGDPLENNPFDTGRYITESLVKELRDAAEDDDIDAIVLRVNSGGGALSTSELIANEVAKVKQQKPIVVSMGNMAASGGYFISSNASAIVASPYTLTGSIGIFAMIPNFAGTNKKLGLTTDRVVTAKKADMYTGQRALTVEEANVIQTFVNEGYDLFLTRVSEGRGMTKEQVDAIGQGRVWLGKNAIELGLVDKLGGIQVAIDEAARLAELDSYRLVYDLSRRDPFKALLGINISTAVEYFGMSEAERATYNALSRIAQMSGVQAIPPYALEVKGMGEVSYMEGELLPTLGL